MLSLAPLHFIVDITILVVTGAHLKDLVQAADLVPNIACTSGYVSKTKLERRPAAAYARSVRAVPTVEMAGTAET